MSWLSIRWALLSTEPTEWSMIINSNIELALTTDVVVQGRIDQSSAIKQRAKHCDMERRIEK